MLVRAYQVTLSPMFGDCCRFTPSCSEYMIESLRVHGAIRGSLLGFRRLLRCHPFGAKGYDPVPPAQGGDALPTGEKEMRSEGAPLTSLNIL